MPRPFSLLLCGLLLGGAAAQSAAPAPAGPPYPPPPSASPAPASPPAPAPTPAGAATFGNPRASSDGSQTRVVFDLAPGVSYTLTPTFGGLRLDVQGARVLPMVSARLGASVSEYRAGAGQAVLFTPFPLSLSDGWRASEATLATGARVLILELGPAVTGGASGDLRALVRVAPPTASVPAVTSTPPAPGPTATTAPADQLPPGDALPPSTVLPPAPALPGAQSEVPSALSGRAAGTPTPGAALLAPRIGKSPGQTRVVLDLPPGTAYRIVPGALGLRVELDGPQVVALTAENLSPELRAWRYEPRGGGGVVTLLTAAPTTARSGWRAQLLPPSAGDRSRLAIDLSPALADLTPLQGAERVLAAVPPKPASSGLAVLALSTSYLRPRVVIDPGHGGRFPGAIGTVIEKNVTLEVALKVRDLLTAAGVDAVLTRDSDRELSANQNDDLRARAAMGVPGTQLFVSIHVNAMDPRTVLNGYGVETWWNPNHPLSSSLAGLLQAHLADVTGAFSRGLKSHQSLSVLRNSRVPAALVEIGYTSHPVDGLNLQDPNYLDRVAVGLARGIREALVTGVTASGPGGAR